MRRQQAINEKCKQCIYDPHAPGNWRQQVDACTVSDCPLHNFRARSESPLPPEKLREYHNYVT